MNQSADRSQALASMVALKAIADKLDIYEALLRRWQTKVNLVGPASLSQVWSRHFVDSTQLAEHASVGWDWVDLGSGAGFPGMVIALLQSTSGFGVTHLVESDARKVAFLREVSRETGAAAVVHHGRVEAILPTLSPHVITSRAMADLPTLFGLVRTHVENGAIALFPKGRDVEAELTRTPIPSNFSIELLPSKTDPHARIVKIRR